MKILQIAPIIERVPPKKYGGIERVVHTLTEELVKKGHDVTLLASGDSITSSRLISVYHKSLREANIRNPYGHNSLILLHLGKAYQMQQQFDIIHDHCGLISLPTANLSQTPVVITIHGVITPSAKRLCEALNNPIFVTISKSQAQPAPRLRNVTIYNGLQMHHYPFGKKDKGYLLFVGRIAMEKGVHYAIEAAQELNLPLVIAAKLDGANPHDTQYFHEYIEPWLSEQIKWIGEVGEKERNILMSNALCMLHPITWREPFGLTLIEAMACGCPVIAFNKGSIPEIIKDGKTGFVVDDLEEMIACIENVSLIDRKYCRKYSLERFNAQRMVDSYEALYKYVLKSVRSNQVLGYKTH